jgi:hypothetical protein
MISHPAAVTRLITSAARNMSRTHTESC